MKTHPHLDLKEEKKESVWTVGENDADKES